jgi:hypothetical protein
MWVRVPQSGPVTSNLLPTYSQNQQWPHCWLAEIRMFIRLQATVLAQWSLQTAVQN